MMVYNANRGCPQDYPTDQEDGDASFGLVNMSVT